MIVLFGAPGSGKTTQVLKLATALVDVQCEVEPTDGVKELIAGVYAKEPGAPFKLQSHVLEQRCKTYLAHQSQKDKLMIADGHILTDYLMFVEAHLESGAISGDERVVYLRNYNQALADFKDTCAKIDVLIFLDVMSESAAKRVAKRESIAEAGVDAAVFEDFVEKAKWIATSFPQDKLVIIDGDDPDEQRVHQKILSRLKPLVDPRHFSTVAPDAPE
jgi:deoxyadenosine/deoxycytidine kinase